MRLSRTGGWRAAVALGLLLALPALPAAAEPRGGVLAGCADASLPPVDTVTLCQQALRDSRLAPAQRAAVLVNLGVAQAALGRQADAELSFGLAIATEPRLVVAHGNRARSRLALGRFREAMEDFDAAIALAPGDAALWLGRGGAHLRAGSPRAAITDLTRAAQLDPQLTDARFNRGIAYLLVEDYARAEADFTAAIAGNPQDAGAYLNRARARAVENPRGAEADFDRAIAIDPEWGSAWASRGLFLEARGRLEEANRDFLRAWELGETDRWLLERLQRPVR